jgi:hypothetical protein
MYLAECIQKHISYGSLPSLNSTPKTFKPNNKKQNKPRAMSGNEIAPEPGSKTFAPARERSQTESNIIIPLQYIPPPVSRDKPWGESAINPCNFNQLQSEESKTPLKVNKWAKKDSGSKPVSFLDLQHEEKDSQDLEEALVLIAIMESMRK